MRDILSETERLYYRAHMADMAHKEYQRPNRFQHAADWLVGAVVIVCAVVLVLLPLAGG